MFFKSALHPFFCENIFYKIRAFRENVLEILNNKVLLAIDTQVLLAIDTRALLTI